MPYITITNYITFDKVAVPSKFRKLVAQHAMWFGGCEVTGWEASPNDCELFAKLPGAFVMKEAA